MHVGYGVVLFYLGSQHISLYFSISFSFLLFVLFLFKYCKKRQGFTASLTLTSCLVKLAVFYNPRFACFYC